MVDRKFIEAQAAAKQWVDLLVAGRVEEAYQLQLEKRGYMFEGGNPIFQYDWRDRGAHLEYMKKCAIDLQEGEFRWLSSVPHSTSVKLTPPKNEAERRNRELGLDREKWLERPDEERYSIIFRFIYRFPLPGGRRGPFDEYLGAVSLHEIDGKFYVVWVRALCQDRIQS